MKYEFYLTKHIISLLLNILLHVSSYTGHDFLYKQEWKGFSHPVNVKPFDGSCFDSFIFVSIFKNIYNIGFEKGLNKTSPTFIISLFDLGQKLVT